MAFPATSWYVNSVAYAAVTAWSNHTATAGEVVRQSTTPAVGNERCFVCIIGGATGSTEPTWTVTRGAKNVSSSATYQECTGQAGVNGDVTNTPAWLSVKNTSVSLGSIIKDAAGTHLFICSTAGTAGNGSEPSWSTAAVGNTTADNTVTWTYIGLASSFAGGAAPHARIPNALATNWAAQGDIVYVSDNHAETSSAVTTILGPSTTTSAPLEVLCHNHTGSYPPSATDLTTGATITSSANVGINITSPNIYMRGVGLVFTANGLSAVPALGNVSSGLQRFEQCPITFSGTAGSSNTISIGSSTARGSRVIMDNCTVTLNNAAQQFQVAGGQWEWRNSSLAGTAPTLLINALQAVDIWVHGVDLSNVGSGGKLASIGSGNGGGFVLLDRCKINNLATVATVTSNSGTIALSKCDGGSVNYRDELYTSAGTVTTETTVVRTGGQSDGTTNISRKAITSSGSVWAMPLELTPIAIWNETVGSAITITLFGIWGGGAVPNNDDFWIDVEYLGSSSSPVSSRATSTKSNVIASASALSSDSSSWGGSTTPFKTSVTITPQQKGYIYVMPKAAKPSTTFYYDEQLLAA